VVFFQAGKTSAMQGGMIFQTILNALSGDI
jgi:hypothetical protein